MRRAAIVLAGVTLLVGVFAAGMVVGRATGSEDEPAEEPVGISDTEHDRLVNACVDEQIPAGECTTWIAERVQIANTDELSYEELAEEINDFYAEDGTPAREPEPVQPDCRYVSDFAREHQGVNCP
jgi:hypothetical protein